MSTLVSISEPADTTHTPSLSVGIDLGTTYSVIVSFDTKPYVIQSNTGQNLTPSAVCYNQNNTYVGAEAITYAQQSHNTLFLSFKRYMGALTPALKQELESTYLQSQASTYALWQTPQGQKTPIDLSAEILKLLYAQAKTKLSESNIKGAVITVPAHFNASQRQATRLAAHRAGIPVLRIINEPTAAAFAYALQKKQSGYFVVYDLGGGTFDLSVLELSDGVFQVLASGGDTNLGGNHFDHSLFDYLCQKHPELHPHDWANHRLTMQSLKEKLCEQGQATYTLRLPSGEVTGCISLDEFEQQSYDLLDRTIRLTRQTLRENDIAIDDIEQLVLVGGSTRMPAVRRALTQLFGQEPLCHLDPDTTVAIGAAAHAYDLCHPEQDTKLLLDVTPLSLGIEVMGGLVEVLIPKNTPIPTAKEELFTTFEDGQTGFVFKIVQGERELASDCYTVGTFELKGLPPKPAGHIKIKLTIQVDVDGTISVFAETLDAQHASEMETDWVHDITKHEITHLSAETAIKDAKIRGKVEQILKARTLLQEVDRFLQHCQNHPKLESLMSQRNMLREMIYQDTDIIDVRTLEQQIESLKQYISSVEP